jgi:hypothetical protein
MDVSTDSETETTLSDTDNNATGGNSVGDLWPDQFRTAERSPIAILREQGTTLNRKTRGVIRGSVRKGLGSRGSILNPQVVAYVLTLEVPALADYKMDLLTIEFNLVVPYPITYRDAFGAEGLCQDEPEFVAALRQTFNNDNALQLISNLIAHAMA